MGLALYLSRVRSSEVLGDLPAGATENVRTLRFISSARSTIRTSLRRLASIRCGIATVKGHLCCVLRPSTTQAMPDTSMPSFVSRATLWDEAIAPKATERVVPAGAEPARHAVLEHEPELPVFENLVTVVHKSP